MRSFCLALCLFLACTAHAGVVTLVFSASDFGSTAPVDPISGSMTWRAATQTSPIEELLSVNLTIAGHTYGLAEIGFNEFFQIGGLISGLSAVNAGIAADDFYFRINPLTEQFETPFYYAVQGISSQLWFSGTSSVGLRFEDGGTVPEPGTLALVAVALLGAASARRSSGCCASSQGEAA